MVKLRFKMASEPFDGGIGTTYNYAFSLGEGPLAEEVGCAVLHLFHDFFFMSHAEQFSCLDSACGGGCAALASLMGENDEIADGVRSRLHGEPVSLLYLEHLLVEENCRSKGFGERILRLLAERHADSENLLITTAAPIDSLGAADDGGEESERAWAALKKRVWRFYEKCGFLHMEKGDGPMFLPTPKAMFGAREP
jgi:GNAT superfamily N-acetyltransferase